jgi:hypothetical protein
MPKNLAKDPKKLVSGARHYSRTGLVRRTTLHAEAAAG